MKKKLYSFILWGAFSLILLAFNLDEKYFFLFNALFILGIAFVLKKQNEDSFICYLIFCGAMNNLVDELFFDNTKIGINEYISLICVPVIWYLKKE
jgi:lipoprotein signal peptidase